MRNACGSNDHPDPVMFVQVFRLLCTYSLVKPPKNSNVCGAELLEMLMQSKELMEANTSCKDELMKKLDALLETQHEADGNSRFVTDQDNSQSETNFDRHLSSHDYDVAATSEEVQAYIAGYVARKTTRLTKCQYCIDLLKTNDTCDRDRVTRLLNCFDGLTNPSEELFQLTKTLEKVVLHVVGKITIKENTLYQIFDIIAQIKNIGFVGCIEHKMELTKKIINFYLVMRAQFLAASFNERNNAKKIKTKNSRKNAKY